MPNKTVGKSAEAAVEEKEGRRRLGSGLIVAFHAFIVAYAVIAVSFAHWGPMLGWMPATIIAAAFGWFGYCLPWIGDAIVMLWDVLSIFT